MTTNGEFSRCQAEANGLFLPAPVVTRVCRTVTALFTGAALFIYGLDAAIGVAMVAGPVFFKSTGRPRIDPSPQTPDAFAADLM